MRRSHETDELRKNLRLDTPLEILYIFFMGGGRRRMNIMVYAMLKIDLICKN